MNIEEINKEIQNLENKGEISDGYHTFDQLYEHRCILFIALCSELTNKPYKIDIWRSKKHSDGSSYEGWFILGINKESGKQITYHLPEKYWNNTNFSETLEKAPEFDGHTSDDVLERLKEIDY